MMRLLSRRSATRSAFFKMPRCREIDGPLMANLDVISPADSSPSRSSKRIWRRVVSASARKTAVSASTLSNIAR